MKFQEKIIFWTNFLKQTTFSVACVIYEGLETKGEVDKHLDEKINRKTNQNPGFGVAIASQLAEFDFNAGKTLKLCSDGILSSKLYSDTRGHKKDRELLKRSKKNPTKSTEFDNLDGSNASWVKDFVNSTNRVSGWSGWLEDGGRTNYVKTLPTAGCRLWAWWPKKFRETAVPTIKYFGIPWNQQRRLWQLAAARVSEDVGQKIHPIGKQQKNSRKNVDFNSLRVPKNASN